MNVIKILSVWLKQYLSAQNYLEASAAKEHQPVEAES